MMNQEEAHIALRLWNRLPAIVRGVVAGAVVGAAGTIPWSRLAAANLAYWPAVPWAVVPTALYLLLYWRYVRGEGWPRATSASRRSSCRANHLPENLLGAALLAGILGLAAVVLLQRVLGRLVTLPQEKPPDLSHMPLPTVVLLLVMSAIVSGVAEEVSFRGYLQKPIEQRHGPVVAILTTGVFFGFAHFSHPEVTLVLLPYYILVAAVYGTLAYLTDSVFPSMILHAGGNLLGSMELLTKGRSEWQAAPAGSPLIWETGPDASFWLSIAAFIVAGVAAIWGYAHLRSVAQGAHASFPTER